MPELRQYWLVALFAELSLGTGYFSKSGCKGDSFKLYHIPFDNNFTLVSIYKDDNQIVMMSMNNSVPNITFLNGYRDKMLLDIHGNILFSELNISDAGKYIIKMETRKGSYDYKVQLDVLVAPTTNCKPKIKRVEDILTVHLESKECGSPEPSVHWLNNFGSLLEESKAIQLPPGKQAGIYHACIVGDVWTCAKISKVSDYCSSFVVDDAQPLQDQEEVEILRNTTVQGTENVSEFGCQGDSFKLYHIPFDNNFTLVSIYKDDNQIVMMSMHNSVPNITFLNGYKDKMLLDINGNIHFSELNISDAGKYIIKMETRNGSYDYEVQLDVLVAPTTNCNPKIKRVEDVLTVHFESKECGSPEPSVNWLKSFGSLLEETKAIKLPPGKQAGVYYACIEGDALRCARSLKLSDFCSFLEVDDEKTSHHQEEAGNIEDDTVQEKRSHRPTKNIVDSTVPGIPGYIPLIGLGLLILLISAINRCLTPCQQIQEKLWSYKKKNGKQAYI